MTTSDIPLPSPPPPPLPSPHSPNSTVPFFFQATPSPDPIPPPGSTPDPQPEKPYHTKRPHKKSRTGCRNCKTRKVKCDEARPSCRSCTLRKAECIYPSPTPPSPTSTSPNAIDGDSSDDRVALVQPPSPVWPNPEELVLSWDLGHRPVGLQVDEVDMKLLWWYTTETYSSLAVDTRLDNTIEGALKVQVVQLAFQNPFLMNSLLGMTSLHLQTCNKQISRVRALRYRAAAFAGYRQAIEAANPDTYAALLACSLMLCAISSQSFREPDLKPLYILDWLVVWRGIGVIVDMTKPKALLESGLKQLFFRPRIDLDETVAHIPSKLLFMLQRVPFTDPEYQHVDTYYTALKYLGSLYKELQLSGFGPILDLRVITFFTFLQQAFVDLARAKRPRALIILAYYLMFMGHVERVWWVKGIGNREIRCIADELGEEWRTMMEVPMASLSTTSHIERARLILGNQEWTPPHAYNLDDKRCKELGWVDDRGREVILETGEVIIPKSPVLIPTTAAATADPNTTAGAEGLAQQPGQADGRTSLYCCRNGPNADVGAQDHFIVPVDQEEYVQDNARAVIHDVPDDVMQPIPFYTRQMLHR